MSSFLSSAGRQPAGRSRPVAAGVLTGILAGTALALAAPLAAVAHVGVTPSSTAAGSTTQLTFAVGHGCEGSATTGLTFTIPEEIVSVTPTVHPNWTAEKVLVDLAQPITDAHGNSLVQRVGQVVYTANTPLEDGFRDTVTLQLTLPADANGSTLAFPVLQTCEVGETDWNQVADEGQDPHDLDHPAPAVDVTAAVVDHAAPVVGAELSASAASGRTTVAEPDLVARGLGLAGLVAGVAAILFVLFFRRPAARVAAPSKGSDS
ncbi:YcnI family protein [Mycetocola sp. 2940]|uniref:YcnI family protein n=1 Tax=Mycetocola sp. 2940 TaxID=3156452 RepID=UPI0033928337